MSTIPGLGHSIAHGVGRFDAAALIGDGFTFSQPRIVEVKGKGPISTVYLEAGPTRSRASYGRVPPELAPSDGFGGGVDEPAGDHDIRNDLDGADHTQ
jgi:hypothetical protein